MLLNRNGTSLMNTFDRRIQLVREPTRFASNNRLRSTAIVLGFILTQLVCMHYFLMRLILRSRLSLLRLIHLVTWLYSGLCQTDSDQELHIILYSVRNSDHVDMTHGRS